MGNEFPEAARPQLWQKKPYFSEECLFFGLLWEKHGSERKSQKGLEIWASAVFTSCVCQQAKGRGGQHHRQHQQEENISIIQLDYTLMHDPHQAPQRTGRPHTFTILAAIESTPGLGLAVLTSKRGYTPHQAAQRHRWIIKHGLTNSVLQSGHETSLMQLVSTVATGLKLPTRVSPPYSHQSQGKVERFHRNLFDQLRTTRLQWSKDLNIEPHMLPPEFLP